MSKKDFISVSELNIKIKDAISKNISEVKVKGELSNLKLSNGATYITLKDNVSSISVICWKTTGLDDKMKNIKNGDDVIITGSVTCYLKSGTCQINCKNIEKVGIGNLHEKYESLKKSFDQKGYFSKKRQIPNKINRIAILTSTEGAALQDVLYVLKSNSFSGEVLVKNCFVQGQNCPESIKAGIEYFNKLNKTKHFDILLITRGGGSFEDLMGYSSKEVVKAIYESSIVTISAVGHEVDCMLSDMAADYRAPTPSIAGDIISSVQKKKKEILTKNLEKITHIKELISNKIANSDDKLKCFSKMLTVLDPVKIINSELEKLEKRRITFENTIISHHDEIFHKLEKLKNKNNQYDVTKTLEKGYNVIVNDDNELISDTKTLKNMINKKQKLKIIFADGELDLSSYINR